MGKNRMIRHCCWLIILSLFLNSCVFYPRISEKEDPCEVVTKELELDVYTDLTHIILNGQKNCNNTDCLVGMAALGIIIPVGSYLVSGSIVLSGNTLYWLEKKGKCEETDFPSFFDHTYKYFDFGTARQVLNTCTVQVYISSSFKKVSQDPKITHKGNPYYCYISFTSEDKEEKPVGIKDIKFTNSDGKIYYVSEGGSIDTKWSENSKEWWGHWSEEEIELEHQTITVAFELIFLENGKRSVQPVTINLEPEYREEKHNDVLDKILGGTMGV